MNPQAETTTDRDRILRKRRAAGASALSCAVLLGMFSITTASMAQAADLNLDLGTASTFSVLAGNSVTNTGESFLEGDLGVAPGDTVSGFRDGQVLGYTQVNNAEAAQAKSDLTRAYQDVASRPVNDVLSGNLDGITLNSGVYNAPGSFNLNGTLTLDAAGDSSRVWVFQVGDDFTTSPAAKIQLANGASACNVFWQVGDTVTLGAGTDFKGSILANSSISTQADSYVEGRALTQNGDVNLDSSVIRNPICGTSVPDPDPTPTDPVTPVPTDPTPTDPTPTDPAPSPDPTDVPTTPAPTPTPTDVPTDTPTDPTPSDPVTTAPVVTTPPTSAAPAPVVTPSPTGASAGGGIDTGVPVDLGDASDADATTLDSTKIDSAADVQAVQQKNLAATGPVGVVESAILAGIALIAGVFLSIASRRTRVARKH